MRLLNARVMRFRNILDSGNVEFDENITCLVGKNESGKTAFLHALYRLLPARVNASFSVPEQYPAWLEKKDRLRGKKLEDDRPVQATFELEGGDVAAIEKRFGPGALKSSSITVSRCYAGDWWIDHETDEGRAVAHVIRQSQVPKWVSAEAKNVKSFGDLDDLIESLRAQSNEEPEGTKAQTARRTEAAEAAHALESTIGEMFGDADDFRKAVFDALSTRVPRFFYYAEYSRLPARCKIRELLEKDPKKLRDDEHTARALLQAAAADDDYLLNPDYERRKRELENVANALTEDVLKYWTQNPELRVLIDISQEIQNTSNGQTSVLDELKVRLYDQRHMLSLPFDEHSTGFRWFFSFLAAFSEYEHRDQPVIILLDEPALGLHARAQADFLRFIEERLAAKHQVIYTTHSPFMITPDRLERVRLVEDRGRDHGAKVSPDVFTTDPDTLFPLQGALGYDLVQHLFIAPHNLVVEGTSDYTYLTVLSDYLKEQDRAFLDERWSLIPVGGADMIPTFVALLGNHLDVTVLIDSQKTGHQRLSMLAEAGYLKHTRIVTIGDVLGRKLADIEDVFTVDDYLMLYNRAFNSDVSSDQLKGTDPLVSRISRHEEIDRFDHGRPADVLLRHRDELLTKLSEDSLTRFEKLFERVNATIPAVLQTEPLNDFRKCASPVGVADS